MSIGRWLSAAAVLCWASALHAAGLQVTDDRGVVVTLPQSPQRIVSLLPSLTETVCELGQCHRLVGVDRYSNHPASVRALPKTGGGIDPNIEAIVALKPDVVLMATSSRGVQRLEALGLKVLAMEPKSSADAQRVHGQAGPVAGGAGCRSHLARHRRGCDGGGAVAAARRAFAARVLRGQHGRLRGRHAVVHRRNDGAPGCAEHRHARSRPVPAHQPRVRGARQPRPDHDRRAQRAGHGAAPGLERHARPARAAGVRVHRSRIRRAGAPGSAHGRSGAGDGALHQRQRARGERSPPQPLARQRLAAGGGGRAAAGRRRGQHRV